MGEFMSIRHDELVDEICKLQQEVEHLKDIISILKNSNARDGNLPETEVNAYLLEFILTKDEYETVIEFVSIKPTSNITTTEGQTNTIKDCLSDIKFKHHGD